MTDYQHIGEEAGLRTIIEEFIDRVYLDNIIGFFFSNVDKAQLIQREIEFASRHLGGPHEYTGRPIAKAHKPHPINTGHFHRRLWLLESVLRKHNVDDALIQRWLEHNKALLPSVTNGLECTS